MTGYLAGLQEWLRFDAAAGPETPSYETTVSVGGRVRTVDDRGSSAGYGDDEAGSRFDEA